MRIVITIICATVLSLLSFGLVEAAPKIQEVRWAAQPDNVEGESVWRYVLDFSDPVKKKPIIKDNKVYILDADLKVKQGQSFGSGTIPSMKIGKSDKQVVLEFFPKDDQKLSYHVFALAADPKKGKKERIVIEITNKKEAKEQTVSQVKSSQSTRNGYSVQNISIDFKQAVNTKYLLDESESGVMVVVLPDTKLGIPNQSYTLNNGDSVTRMRIGPDGKNTDVVLSMSTFFRKEDIKVSLNAGDVQKGINATMKIEIQQKLPDYDYSVSGSLKGKKIVIDAGHGGSDPGAVGPTGLQEKNVTLGMAKRLGNKLESRGAKVFYTRTTDVDVAGVRASGVEELHKRIEVGHVNKADLFISFHADAAVSSSAEGTTVYYYPKSRHDAALSTAVQQRLKVSPGRYDRGIREAGFYVLKKTWIPSILVETAFISNPEEEKLLNQAEFQEKIAQAVCEGIADFYK